MRTGRWLVPFVIVLPFTATAGDDEAPIATASATPVAAATPAPAATSSAPAPVATPSVATASVTPPTEATSVRSSPAATASAMPIGPPAAKPPPYSLPWQLRTLTVGNVIRSDTSVAFYDATDAAGVTTPGTTVSSMLLATYKITPKLAPLVRLAFVYNNEPAGPAGGAVVNPLAGATYATSVGRLKVAAFGAATVPIGEGGGESPEPGDAKAAARGIPARSAMDNAMFATNYVALIAGLGGGYIKDGFTAQAEITVLQLFKVRGPQAEDDAGTNFTAGVHTGYFLAPALSVGGELRYQRWLSDAAPVVKDAHARETVTFGIGPRLHLKLEGKQWIRPGISYSRVLDAPWSNNSYQIVQFDVPYIF